MIGRPRNNQSTKLARSYPIWRLGTYARDSQRTGKSHQNGRDLLGVIRPMLLPKPNQTARNIQMSHLYQLTLCPKTHVQTQLLTNSP
jgi:hypothetical protein